MSIPKHELLPQGALIELERHGHSIKVSAVDPVTYTEVSITGPVTATQAELENTAVDKLIWRLRKNAGEKSPEKRTLCKITSHKRKNHHPGGIYK